MSPADLLASEARRERAFEGVARLCGQRSPQPRYFTSVVYLSDESEAILIRTLQDSEALAAALREAWAREAPASLGEALNSGDGTYRP